MNQISPQDARKSAADFGISMTDGAAARIRDLSEREGRPVMLRVSVAGGGCSGFQYSFGLDETRNDDDLVLEKSGATLVIDNTSITLLQGSQIDWHEDLAASMFVINNPNASSSCGCGTSFMIG